MLRKALSVAAVVEPMRFACCALILAACEPAAMSSSPVVAESVRSVASAPTTASTVSPEAPSAAAEPVKSAPGRWTRTVSTAEPPIISFSQSALRRVSKKTGRETLMAAVGAELATLSPDRREVVFIRSGNAMKRTPRELSAIAIDSGKLTSLGRLPEDDFDAKAVRLLTFDQGVCVLFHGDQKRERVFQWTPSEPLRELATTDSSPCRDTPANVEDGTLVVRDSEIRESEGKPPILTFSGEPKVNYAPSKKLALLEVPFGGIVSDRLLLDFDTRTAYEVTAPSKPIPFDGLGPWVDGLQSHGFYDSGLGTGEYRGFFLSDDVLVAGTLTENATPAETLVLILPARRLIKVDQARIARP